MPDPAPYVPTTSDTLVALILAALSVPKTAAVAAGGANVGNGIVRDVETASPIKIGAYALAFTDADNFTVAEPGGAQIGTGVVGGPLSQGVADAGLAFYVKAGSVPFAAGDSFTLTTAWPTLVRGNIFAPRDWPTQQDKYPMLKIGSPRETKESLGPNGPQFNTTTTVQVKGSLSVVPKKGDVGAGIAQALLGALQRQIEVAVINDYALFLVIQEMVSVDIVSQVVQSGTEHLGELTMDFAMKFPQGPEDFAPVPTSTIAELRIFADLVNVDDPSGTYDPPMDYTPTPAPRSSGPDGRVEGELAISIADDEE